MNAIHSTNIANAHRHMATACAARVAGWRVVSSFISFTRTYFAHIGNINMCNYRNYNRNTVSPALNVVRSASTAMT